MDAEPQRQKDIEALTTLLDRRGVPRRMLKRCPDCDAYRIHSEPCPLCENAEPDAIDDALWRLATEAKTLHTVLTDLGVPERSESGTVLSLVDRVGRMAFTVSVLPEPL